MNKNKQFALFAAEALACLALAIALAPSGSMLAVVLAFPFAQIGAGLRWLSLLGAGGNAAAVVLYVAFSLLPCVYILLAKRKRGLHMEDGLLALSSALLFMVLYQMVNPALLPLAALGDTALLKAIPGAAVHSVLGAYIVLRALRLFFESETQQLQKYMLWLFGAVNAVFVYALFGAGVSGLINNFSALRAGGGGGEHYVFLLLKFVVDSIPTAFNIAVVFSCSALLRAVSQNRYSQATVAAAEKLSRVCNLALVATMVSNAAFNVLQFLFAANLGTVNSNVEIPLFSVLFVLAALLLSRFAGETKALKEDSESII